MGSKKGNKNCWCIRNSVTDNIRKYIFFKNSLNFSSFTETMKVLRVNDPVFYKLLGIRKKFVTK